MAQGASKPSKQLVPTKPASRASAPSEAKIIGPGGGMPSGAMGIPQAPRGGLGQQTVPRNTTVSRPPPTTYSTTVNRPAAAPPASPPSTFNPPASTPPSSFRPSAPLPPSTINLPPGAPRPTTVTVPRPGQPGEFPPFEIDRRRSFSCSAATLEFLRTNIIRNSDLQIIDLTGETVFDRTVGVHTIPLTQPTERFAAPAASGAFVIGRGQAFIVTKFQPFAGVPNVGLPGAYTTIDPLSLAGQVGFYLLGSGGHATFNQQTITPNSIINGTSILSPLISDQNTPSLTVAIEQESVSAVYQVVSPPFPGFPKIVGVRVKGYLIDAILLKEIMDGCVDLLVR